MGLLGWFASAFANFFSTAVAQFTATKLVLIAIFTLVLPVVLNNLIYDLVVSMLNSIDPYMQQIQANMGASSTVSVAGIGAWAVSLFRIPECVAVLMSAVSIRLSLSLIPFLKV